MTLVVATQYVQGAPPQKATEIVEERCGLQVTYPNTKAR